jgi:hypothetical protein
MMSSGSLSLMQDTREVAAGKGNKEFHALQFSPSKLCFILPVERQCRLAPS